MPRTPITFIVTSRPAPTHSSKPMAFDRDAVKVALHDHIVGEILFADGPLGGDEDLFDAGFDSMSLTRILVFIEKRFGVVIPDEDVVIDEVATINSMTDFVAGYIERA